MSNNNETFTKKDLNILKTFSNKSLGWRHFVLRTKMFLFVSFMLIFMPTICAYLNVSGLVYILFVIFLYAVSHILIDRIKFFLTKIKIL